MPQLIFTFTVNTETKDASFSGNIAPAVALKFLQDIVIAESVMQAEKENAEASNESQGKRRPADKD